jgi:MFS family permease
MSASSSVNITELIDRRPLGRMQITIIVLCGLVALLDGFDLLAIGVAAPAMAGPLHIAPNQLGVVFSAALFGLMLGAFGLGPIADRYGRRYVLIGATATFGVFTLCTASAATLQQVLLFRFLAGVGLGGAMPSFISLAAEYTPRAQRQAVVGLLWTGFPLGGVMVGLLASRLVPAVGWQSLFYIGGILPLGLSIVLIRSLPDSIEFLVMRGAARPRIRYLLARINPTVDIASDCQFVSDGEKNRGRPVWQLFSAGRVGGTILLWASYFVYLHVVGDQRDLDTNVASESRNRRRAIVDGNGSVRLGQRGRNPDRRVSGQSLPRSKRPASRFGWQCHDPRRSRPGKSIHHSRYHFPGAGRLLSWCCELRSHRSGAFALLHGHSLDWRWLGDGPRPIRLFCRTARQWPAH